MPNTEAIPIPVITTRFFGSVTCARTATEALPATSKRQSLAVSHASGVETQCSAVARAMAAIIMHIPLLGLADVFCLIRGLLCALLEVSIAKFEPVRFVS